MMLLWTLFSALSALPSASATALSADQAVAEALARSRALAQADAAASRAAGTVKAQCGLRHDPTVTASAAVVGEAWSVSLAQPLSLTGEGVAACAAAKGQHDAARAGAARAGLVVAAETRRAWVAAVVARQQLGLAADALEVAVRIEAAARQREAVGEASELDLRLARLQVERVRTAWMTAAVDEGQRVAELAVAVGMAVSAVDLPADPLEGVAVPLDDAAGVRDDVAAASASAAAAQSAVRREQAATVPAVELGVFVEEEGLERRAGPSVTVTLPVWRGNVDGKADARAALAVAQTDLDAAEHRAAAEQATTTRVGAALEAALADQGQDIPAQARAALDSVALGYDRGELDLLSTAQFQTEILAGHSAWLDGRRVVAEARLARMLAQGDPRLLGGAGD